MKAINGMILLVFFAALFLTICPGRASANEMDLRIESAAQKSYVFKKYLKDDDINVVSENGAVILKGTVADESHKQLAQETVANLPGVKSVDDQLKVKGGTTDENPDAWITMKVKAALLFHRNVSAMTEVTTRNGIVMLHGKAENEAQKDLTTAYVKDIAGVKGVNNEMTVGNGSGQPVSKVTPALTDLNETVDDASVTAMVKMTLLYHRSTSALHTKVVTNNGLVVLSGTASSGAEKDLATRYAEDVPGVKKVDNEMIVEKNRAD